MAYVYRHIRLDTNTPFYIGIGKDDKGWYWRARNKSNRSDEWKYIFNTCGEYRVDILFDEIEYDEAIEKEKEFIAFYGRDILCNKTNGGEGSWGYIRSAETRQKLRNANIGKKLTPEHVENSKRGVKRYRELYGNKPMSEETKIKLSIANTGYKHTQEAKDKLSKKHAGKKLSEETKQKIGFFWKGRKRSIKNCDNISKGKLAKNLKYSEETKKKLSNAHKRQSFQQKIARYPSAKTIKAIDTNTGAETIYWSIQNASKSIGISATTIKNKLKGIKCAVGNNFILELVPKA